MASTYEHDEDLSFLAQCSNDDLDTLVRYMVLDKDGDVRTTEEMTDLPAYASYFKEGGPRPDHQAYWKEIAAEFQYFGANTFGAFFTGSGRKYGKILRDVSDKLDVNYNDSASTQMIEMNLLMKILTDSLDRMSDDERRQVVESLKISVAGFAAPGECQGSCRTI